jgi:hypothetical protein
MNNRARLGLALQLVRRSLNQRKMRYGKPEAFRKESGTAAKPQREF